MVNLFQKCLLGVIASGFLTSCQQPAPPLSDVPMRSFEHAMGTTDIPVSPERVVVLDSAPLSTAFALGMLPIGRPEKATSFIYPEVNDDITSVGEGFRPNMETILDLSPDLILGSKVMADGSYQTLSRIAPTVFSEDNGRYGNWQTHFLLHADALGQLEQAEDLLVDYQQRVDSLKSQLNQIPQETVVSVITHWSGGVLAYTANSFSGSVLRDLGFKRNPVQSKSKKYALQPAQEDLAVIDGDILFLMYDLDRAHSVARADFVRDPLWSTLKAVTDGVVCEVSGTVWAGGRSVLAANQILKDIEDCLATTLIEN